MNLARGDLTIIILQIEKLRLRKVLASVPGRSEI